MIFILSNYIQHNPKYQILIKCTKLLGVDLCYDFFYTLNKPKILNNFSCLCILYSLIYFNCVLLLLLYFMYYLFICI